ncbi:hypothetical protein BCR33DRAFT_49627 [Rhizoclosmatium globosum]|uniref:Uncharacterized protein n=1 Tax=Rhizoclosmatium globosum TaxID=329046 RepID=A0A1Y2AV06_9FUNG|nr:hypothetical protein BCR33DRAFT_49627 [Rhizoclosmatium globosum]|eukprot:ORY26399.1 hypothetical protein BCR33DRAFT_49627 [Rhizoclosmatium globosum]
MPKCLHRIQTRCSPTCAVVELSGRQRRLAIRHCSQLLRRTLLEGTWKGSVVVAGSVFASIYSVDDLRKQALTSEYPRNIR